MTVPCNGAWPGLDLYLNQARGSEDEQIDLIDPSFVVDELKVGPCAPGFVVGKMAAREVQRFALPRKRALTHGGPTRHIHEIERAPLRRISCGTIQIRVDNDRRIVAMP
jgi:hypothetical protein